MEDESKYGFQKMYQEKNKLVTIAETKTQNELSSEASNRKIHENKAKNSEKQASGWRFRNSMS